MCKGNWTPPFRTSSTSGNWTGKQQRCSQKPTPRSDGSSFANFRHGHDKDRTQATSPPSARSTSKRSRTPITKNKNKGRAQDLLEEQKALKGKEQEKAFRLRRKGKVLRSTTRHRTSKTKGRTKGQTTNKEGRDQEATGVQGLLNPARRRSGTRATSPHHAQHVASRGRSTKCSTMRAARRR